VGGEPRGVRTALVDKQLVSYYDESGNYVLPSPNADTASRLTANEICDEVQYPDEWSNTTLRSRVEALAEEAVNAVCGVRNKDYGDPRFDMAATAEMMNGYLHKRGLLPEDQFLQPFDVPMLLELVKVSRLAGQPGHHDSMVDIIGWMGVYQECAP